jgi:hypothetical protein
MTRCARATHGVPRTNEDKRRAVMKMLTADLVKLDDQGAPWSARDIAKQCRVSHTFVDKLREQIAPPVVTGNVASEGTAPTSEHTYTTKHGTVAKMNTRWSVHRDQEAMR